MQVESLLAVLYGTDNYNLHPVIIPVLTHHYAVNNGICYPLYHTVLGHNCQVRYMMIAVRYSSKLVKFWVYYSVCEPGLPVNATIYRMFRKIFYGHILVFHTDLDLEWLLDINPVIMFPLEKAVERLVHIPNLLIVTLWSHASPFWDRFLSYMAD